MNEMGVMKPRKTFINTLDLITLQNDVYAKEKKNEIFLLWA